MSRELVPRYESNYGDTQIVEIEDVAKLEAALEAAVEMRESVRCPVNSIDGIVMEDAPYKTCRCDTCDATRAFDAAMEKVNGK